MYTHVYRHPLGGALPDKDLYPQPDQLQTYVERRPPVTRIIVRSAARDATLYPDAGSFRIVLTPGPLKNVCKVRLVGGSFTGLASELPPCVLLAIDEIRSFTDCAGDGSFDFSFPLVLQGLSTDASRNVDNQVMHYPVEVNIGKLGTLTVSLRDPAGKPVVLGGGDFVFFLELTCRGAGRAQGPPQELGGA
jgi:hypothetical protein